MSPQTALDAFITFQTRSTRDDLVLAFWYLTARGARKFARAGVDRADLVQIGAIGLLKAVEQYDPTMQTPFEAYAWLLVVGELMHYVRDHERVVRIPRSLRSLEKRYCAAEERLIARLGRSPSPAELAREIDVNSCVIDELRALRRGGSTTSLEALTGSMTGELPARESAQSVDERVTLLMALSELADRERIVVLGSFAAGLSQAELGRRLGLSQSQVSKLIKKALSKISAQVA